MLSNADVLRTKVLFSLVAIFSKGVARKCQKRFLNVFVGRTLIVD